METDREHDLLFEVLQFNDKLPQLDLHGILPVDAARLVKEFLLEQAHDTKINGVRIIYGCGGTGVLRAETMSALQALGTGEKAKVLAFREEERSGRGSCVVLLRR